MPFHGLCAPVVDIIETDISPTNALHIQQFYINLKAAQIFQIDKIDKLVSNSTIYAINATIWP